MKKVYTYLLLLLFVMIVFPGFAVQKASASEVVPSYGDAVVILAKYSGLFDDYISNDSSLNECVSFFNEKGIYFGLMEVVNGAEFTVAECARVMGQIELLLSGEAQYSMGKVMLPKGIDSWIDFCIINDVKYVKGYEYIVKGIVAFRRIGN